MYHRDSNAMRFRLLVLRSSHADTAARRMYELHWGAHVRAR